MEPRLKRAHSQTVSPRGRNSQNRDEVMMSTIALLLLLLQIEVKLMQECGFPESNLQGARCELRVHRTAHMPNGNRLIISTKLLDVGPG